MQEPQSLRVLLVERPPKHCGLAKQLISNYDLDFGWACAPSPLELLKLAEDFKPNIVLCAEYNPADWRAPIEALRLLCERPPVILVSTLLEARPSAAGNTKNQLLEHLQRAAEEPMPPSDSDRDLPNEDQACLRGCFSTVLESSESPVVMSDSDGWISFANTSACRALAATSASSIGTWLDEPVNPSRRARLAYFDPRTGRSTPIHVDTLIRRLGARTTSNRSTLAFVATALRSARISGEARSYSLGDGEPSSSPFRESEAPLYGSVVRVTPHDYLLALPEPCSTVEAAFRAQQVLESLAADFDAPPADLPAPAWPVIPDVLSISTGSVATYPAARVKREEKEGERLELDLADALKRHALNIQYQPQYELGTGRGCGVEALVRWTLASGKIVSPSKFIPIAEKSGMIHDLGAWVLHSACEAAAQWCPLTSAHVTLSVNVSALQIDAQFVGVLARTLRYSGFAANQLELEITESALIRNPERTIEYLKEWKELGVRIAIDDFGTGYSSLSYLSRLPVDCLKLDQSLIHRMTMDAKSAAVARSIVSLGAELGLDVIAEGVETEQQFQMLGTLGCPRMQGYLLGRPMSATQAQVVLRKTWGNRPAPRYPRLRPAAAVHEVRQAQ